MSDHLEKLRHWLGEGNDCQWWALPSPEKPRIIVPTSPKHWNAALTLVNPKKRLLLKAFLWFSKLRRKSPDIKGSTANRLIQFVSDHVAAVSKGVSIYVGTESIYKKFTIQLQNSQGRPVGYVKLAETERSKQSIQHESDALNYLADHVDQNQYFFPKLLAHAEGVSLQSCRSEIHVKKATNTQVRSILKSLEQLDKSVTSWAKSDIREYVASTLQNVEGSRKVHSALLEGIQVLDTAKFDELHQHYMHGDFVDWNMHGSDKGFVYDWEWAGSNTKYHDFFHYIWFPIMQSQRENIGEYCYDALQLKSNLKLLTSKPDTTELIKYGLFYALWRLAFYSSSCVLNGDKPEEFSFIQNFIKLVNSLIILNEQTIKETNL